MNSPFSLLHISLQISHKNLVLDQDQQSLPNKFEYPHYM